MWSSFSHGSVGKYTSESSHIRFPSSSRPHLVATADRPDAVFLLFSLLFTTATHDNVMPLRTYHYPTYLLPNSAHTFLYASCRHIPDRVLALVFQKKKKGQVI